MRLNKTHCIIAAFKMALVAALGFSPFTLATEKNVDKQFEVGKEKAKVCMTCHGADGISTIDAYPNLRGQNKTYLISSLKDYKTRERTSGLAVLMQQQADALTDQDIEDISHYYSLLGSETSPAVNEPQP